VVVSIVILNQNRLKEIRVVLEDIKSLLRVEDSLYQSIVTSSKKFRNQ
jgi:hypothetical protein